MNDRASDTAAYAGLPAKVRRAVQYAEDHPDVHSVEVTKRRQGEYSTLYIELTGTLVTTGLIQQVNHGRLKVKRLRGAKTRECDTMYAKFEVRHTAVQ